MPLRHLPQTIWHNSYNLFCGRIRKGRAGPNHQKKKKAPKPQKPHSQPPRHSLPHNHNAHYTRAGYKPSLYFPKPQTSKQKRKKATSSLPNSQQLHIKRPSSPSSHTTSLQPSPLAPLSPPLTKTPHKKHKIRRKHALRKPALRHPIHARLCVAVGAEPAPYVRRFRQKARLQESLNGTCTPWRYTGPASRGGWFSPSSPRS